MSDMNEAPEPCIGISYHNHDNNYGILFYHDTICIICMGFYWTPILFICMARTFNWLGGGISSW